MTLQKTQIVTGTFSSMNCSTYENTQGRRAAGVGVGFGAGGIEQKGKKTWTTVWGLLGRGCIRGLNGNGKSNKTNKNKQKILRAII